MRRARRSGNI
jgi:hypothetical protein